MGERSGWERGWGAPGTCLLILFPALAQKLGAMLGWIGAWAFIQFHLFIT